MLQTIGLIFTTFAIGEAIGSWIQYFRAKRLTKQMEKEAEMLRTYSEMLHANDETISEMKRMTALTNILLDESIEESKRIEARDAWCELTNTPKEAMPITLEEGNRYFME